MGISSFTASDGTGIAYRDEGRGLPVLCLSGLTRNGTDFDYLAPHAKNLRLIRMDYRGRGFSDWNTDFESYSLQREGQDALELLDHLGLDRAAILGTSRGGLIAMGLASGHKERLLGVMMNDIGPVLEPEGLTNIMAHLGRPPPFTSYAQAQELMPARATGFANVPAARWAQEVRNRWADMGDRLALRYDPKLRKSLETLNHTEAPDMWPFFDALDGIPLALVRGENSDLLSRETVAEMKRRRPDMIFAEAKDRAHIPFLDEPESLDVFHRFAGAIT